MISKDIQQEFSMKGINLAQVHSASHMRKIYQNLYENKDELSFLALGYFYLFESREEDNTSFDLEIAAIIADISGKIATYIEIELMIVLAKDFQRQSNESKFQKILERISFFEKSLLKKSQIDFLNENFIEVNNNPSLKGKEFILYSELEKGPMEKFDLIFLIYGINCDISKSERSFKTLLNRVRKKISKEIVLNTEGMYELR